MTDKEFKQLNRPQLIDIIYQLQLQIDTLTEKNRSLEQALADKRLRISNAGNLAEAALEINNCFRSAQDAAEQYLTEIKIMRDEIRTLQQNTQTERDRILANAHAEARIILINAQKKQRDFESEVDALLQEYRRRH